MSSRGSVRPRKGRPLPSPGECPEFQHMSALQALQSSSRGRRRLKVAAAGPRTPAGQEKRERKGCLLPTGADTAPPFHVQPQRPASCVRLNAALNIQTVVWVCTGLRCLQQPHGHTRVSQTVQQSPRLCRGCSSLCQSSVFISSVHSTAPRPRGSPPSHPSKELALPSVLHQHTA